MKTTLITDKIPELIDYALAVVLSSVPGIAESDTATKQLYQAIAKEMIAQELRSKRDFAKRNIKLLTKKRRQRSFKMSA